MPIEGSDGNDVIIGGNGQDIIIGGDGDDILFGGNGGDALAGGAGNDQLYGQNGSDHLIGGEGDDLVDGNSGFDTAYYSGPIDEYTFLASAGYLHIIHQGGAGADGHDRVIRVERLVFANRVIEIGSGHNRPVAGDDHVALDEESGTHDSGAASVLDNDFDFDGDPLTVTGGTFVGTYGTLTLNADGTYSYALFASVQELASGEIVQDSFDYTVSDNDGSDTGRLVFNIAGLNDAPTANPDAAIAVENEKVLIAVLANDDDIDNGAVLTVTAASAPAGQGTASVVDNQVEFDPGSDFDALAAGDSVDVAVGYEIVDEQGATSSSTVTITVTGANDAPVARPETAATDENAAIAIDVLANDSDVDNGATLTVTAASSPSGQGSAAVVGGNRVEFDPGTDFDHLAAGGSEIVVVGYDVEDEHGASSSSMVTITVTGTNDGPVATADAATAGENEKVTIDVIANDEDVDNGAVLTVTSASAPAGQGSAAVVDNLVEFDPGSDFDSLAVGDSVGVEVGYSITDEHGATSSSTIAITVTGANDGPVANPETGATDENAAILIDVLANDTDVDNGAILTVTAASVPAGKGAASVVANQVAFDPGTDFDDLALGETEIVVVGYDIEDEHGASASSTVTITVTGTNDGPVARPDTATTSEQSGIVVNVLANDSDADSAAVMVVTGVSSPPAGQGSASIVENQIRFEPGSDFAHLAAGESAVVVLNYTIEDEYGVQSSASLTITVQGRDEGVSGIGTEESDTLVGTPGDDMFDALGGDDSVFGLGGDDLIYGGSGNDFLNGEDDDDVVEGGVGDDVLSGGDGNDQLSGQAGSDNLAGENGDDQLSGGDGFDQLSGDAGTDVIHGGNDDDLLSGGDGNDQLSGEAGNDNLDGGEGDDMLAGGDGDDFLSDSAGTNSFSGGLGNDHILAGSSDGAQTIDGGAGNDTIRHSSRHFASTITTGSGSDAIELVQADLGTAAIVVTDFAAGAGGDIVRLSGDGGLLSLLSGWDASSNPFGGGFLRLEQSGPDTLFQWDRNGAGGGSDWETLIVFQNSNAGAFTEANFVPVYHPDGSDPAGETITGTSEDDSLTGTIGADTIDALAGNDFAAGASGADLIRGGDGDDQLYGDAGNDVIEGGNDDDFQFGGEGNDQLFGQAGHDALFGEKGGDQLSGGNGDDSLDGGGGDDALIGGAGNDYLSGGLGSNVLTGGIGADHIVADSTDAAQTIDAGDGDDTIRHTFRHFASAIATGSGRDTIELAYADSGSAAIVVTDFTPGSGGDVMLLSGDGGLLSLLAGWDGSSNPFGTGFLRLQQSGADTWLQWDQDGSASGPEWETLAVFQDSNAGHFTDANFVPGYHPNGSAPAGETIAGSAGDDMLTGTIGADTIDALGGDDIVFGRAGADLIDGGDGFDQLHGEADDDVIEGGNDDDSLWGGSGDDSLLGQAGNDVHYGEDGDDELSGGTGDDHLDGGAGDDMLTGGDGQDFLTDLSGTNSFTGGLGDDHIVAGSADGAQTVNGGDGKDIIRHYYRHFASTITTGAGSDTIELARADLGAAAIVVTDFTTGSGGDVFRLEGDEGLLSLLSGWDGSNPFGAGFLRLHQSGADTLFQWDQDGGEGGSSWETLAIFQNRASGAFIDVNFMPGYNPGGSAPAGETITGTAGDDRLTGTIGADTIDGLGGNDFVKGGAAADLIRGGDGSDQLHGEADDDAVEGGNNDDILFGGDGIDQLSGNAGGDTLDGGGGGDLLLGGDGDDFLSGGNGSDVLTGGLGADNFSFQLPSDGPDDITDFAPGTDLITVSASGFGGDLSFGRVAPLITGSDPTPSDAKGQFLYDTDDGRLFWDSDGTGSEAAQLIATFSNIPALTPSDFFVAF